MIYHCFQVYNATLSATPFVSLRWLTISPRSLCRSPPSASSLHRSRSGIVFSRSTHRSRLQPRSFRFSPLTSSGIHSLKKNKKNLSLFRHSVARRTPFSRAFQSLLSGMLLSSSFLRSTNYFCFQEIYRAWQHHSPFGNSHSYRKLLA